jgi:phosphatidylserine/phosphatidylglycerophosphate/cardiolipin synthase-like enzyme
MEAVVFFSKIKEEIVSNLNKATQSIKVAVAWLTDEDIIRVLTQRREAGIEIQIAISDSKENFKNTLKFKDFIRLQGEFFVATHPFLHHKFCVIDDKIIINGSYNWSYPARGNEENIIVVTINKNSKEDLLFLEKFVVKHRFLCNKCCEFISDYQSLKKYKEKSKDTALVQAVLDEEEIMLRQTFENDVRTSFEKSLAAKIAVSHSLLERMKSDGGGVEFVKRILHDEMTSGEMKSGFRKLEESIPHRVDLSLEYLVSKPMYESLFKPEEIQFCKNLMRKYSL